MLKKTAILKLQTEAGLPEGHSADFLERSVENLLLHPAELDQNAQEALLAEVEPVFSGADNQQFLARPTIQKVYEVVSASNLNAAPGTELHSWSLGQSPRNHQVSCLGTKGKYPSSTLTSRQPLD